MVNLNLSYSALNPEEQKSLVAKMNEDIESLEKILAGRKKY